MLLCYQHHKYADDGSDGGEDTEHQMLEFCGGYQMVNP